MKQRKNDLLVGASVAAGAEISAIDAVPIKIVNAFCKAERCSVLRVQQSAHKPGSAISSVWLKSDCIHVDKCSCYMALAGQDTPPKQMTVFWCTQHRCQVTRLPYNSRRWN